MDATKRPLIIPPDIVNYAEDKHLFDMFKEYLTELIVNKPDDPLSFMLELLKRPATIMPRYVILGAPYSGKTTLAYKLEKELTVPTEVFRVDELQELSNVPIKNEVPLPTDVVVQWTRNKIKSCVNKGWMLVGIPQNREQALALQKEGINPTHAIVMKPEDTRTIIRKVSASRKRSVSFSQPRRSSLSIGALNDLTRIQSDVQMSSTGLSGRRDVAEQSEINDKLYQRYIEPMISCYINRRLFDSNKLLDDIILQVVEFIQNQVRSASPFIPRLLLLGVPGCGKNTQAVLLWEKYNLVNVNCGVLLNESIAKTDKYCVSCKSAVKKVIVPTKSMVNLVKKRIGQLDCISQGWVLHGFPQTKEQAEALQEAGIIPNKVIVLEITDELSLERLSKRRVDPVSGKMYHVTNFPPPDSETNRRLLQHPWDSEEHVMKILSESRSFGQIVQHFYPNRVKIDASQDPHSIFETIESIVINSETVKVIKDKILRPHESQSHLSLVSLSKLNETSSSDSDNDEDIPVSGLGGHVSYHVNNVDDSDDTEETDISLRSTFIIPPTRYEEDSDEMDLTRLQAVMSSIAEVDTSTPSNSDIEVPAIADIKDKTLP